MLQKLASYINKSHHHLTLKSYKWFSFKIKAQNALKKINIETQQGKTASLMSSGMVVDHKIDQKLNKITISLNLNKDYRRIKQDIKTQLSSQGIQAVDIVLAPKTKEQKFNRKGNLLGIKKIIAVSSCKGGVGKSTVAVNVAATLKNQGYKVGIFDSDIYGPSLPTLINRQGQTLTPHEQNEKQIQPIDYQGMKCMSFGFVGQKPAVMRGPIVSSIVSQLLYQTHWGELDYLVVDMPPGTGDIQLSLCQQLKFDGALIVTTPQRLSFIDVIKGIQMFQDLRVRIVGIVQNMSYYQCTKCGNHDVIFGRGYTQMMMEQFGIDNTIRLPLLSQISKYSDNGTPLAFVLPQQHSLIKIYNGLCSNIKNQLQKSQQRVFVFYNTSQRQIIIEGQGIKKKVSPYSLRIACRCAGCIDQLSGAMILKRQEVDPEVFPSRIEEKGNYAVAIVWSDGHRSSIYPYKRLLSKEITSS